MKKGDEVMFKELGHLDVFKVKVRNRWMSFTKMVDRHGERAAHGASGRGTHVNPDAAVIFLHSKA